MKFMQIFHAIWQKKCLPMLRQEAQETNSILEQIREDLTNADTKEQELNNPLRVLKRFY